MNKRNIWKYDETKELLQIMLEKNFAASFTTRHHRNVLIFRKIERLLFLRGYPYKNFEQIAVRWKNLKNLYTRAKRSKDPNQRQLFPFYEEMEELLSSVQTKPPESGSEQAMNDADTDDAAEETVDGGRHREASEDRTEQEETTQQDPRQSLPLSARPLRRNPRAYGRRRSTGFDAIIAESKQELSDEFYRTQKRLIDYEFSLHAQREEAYMNEIQSTTRAMLEEQTERFFCRLNEFFQDLSSFKDGATAANLEPVDPDGP
ncbi:zinc finger and SCAN domain-containing protein 29-like [Anopheles cruzii]|uniref:zinc finger and SCAN domain-containing protein 29-like n=1 Tax=Anopheles cruzii TaxID=68878 RepID=UPI0022EC760F|nr:zinc finger and SCAN domain-containing protein 29-like [Anopheles cruzii]